MNQQFFSHIFIINPWSRALATATLKSFNFEPIKVSESKIINSQMHMA
jgi:hypothetical protein